LRVGYKPGERERGAGGGGGGGDGSTLYTKLFASGTSKTSAHTYIASVSEYLLGAKKS